MGRLQRIAVVIVTATAVAACSSGGAAEPSARKAKAVEPGDVPPLEQRYETFDPTAFDASSADVDNRYFPLTPGVRLVYQGSDRRNRSHRIEVVTTDLIQVVDGVRSAVVWERDFDGSALEEAELSYFAQDTAGSVWHLGEYSETYEDGELAGATGFLQGHLEGARAGIMMPADPRPGTPSFSEGYGPPPIFWTDRAKVVADGLSVTVPSGTYHDVLLVEEYSEQERTGFQRKYYAPGVGNVKVGWRGDDEAREVLGLTTLEQLDASGIAKTRAAARDLEARAKMYGSTPPSQVRST